jgi:CRP/FNR family cyclic AMP-dependent transcriptional regulator
MLTPAQAIAQAPLFADLPASTLERLETYMRTVRFEAGDVIFRDGDPGTTFFVVLSGEVSIDFEAGPNQRVNLALVRPGHAFGEVSLLDEGPRSAGATATEDTALLALARDDFLTLLRDEPAAVNAVLRTLGAMIRRTNQRISDLMFLDVPARFAKAFADLVRGHGTQVADGVLIDRDVSADDLAGMTGLHPLQVEGLLADYQYQDLLRLEAGQYVVRPRYLAQLDGPA